MTAERSVPTGKVKWFDTEKGFGFLSREGGPDVFVHKDALPAGVATLKPGLRVEYGIVQGKQPDRFRWFTGVKVKQPVGV